MTKETVRETLLIQANNVIPALINEEFLLSSGLIESIEDIDRSMYHVSSNGTHIQILDEYQTTLDVRIPYIKVRSSSPERLKQFFKALETERSKLRVGEIGFNQVVHLSAESIYKTVSKNLCNVSMMSLDQIRFVKDSHIIELHECKKDRIHIHYEFEKLIEPHTPIKELEINIDDIINSSKTFINKFIKEELKLDVE